MKKYIIGFYRKCDLLTMFSICTAFLGLMLALASHYTIAIVCLMICGICDAFDGKLARKYKYSKKQQIYGQQLDSLSDAFCFGAFPALLTCLLSNKISTYFIATIYLLCGIVRLAYFNMLASDDNTKPKGFIGIPITTVAITYPIFFLLLRFINFELIPKVLPFILLLQAISFIINIKIPKYDFTKIISKILNKYVINYILFPMILIVLGNIFFASNYTNFQGIINEFKSGTLIQIYIVLWISMLCMAMTTIFGNTKKGNIVTLVIMLIILFINDVKYMTMGSPLEISDINYLNPDNVKMMAIATTTIGAWIFKVIFKSIIYIFVGVLIIYFDKYHAIQIKGVWKRLGLSIVFIILFLLPILPIDFFNRFEMTKIYKITQNDILTYNSSFEIYAQYGFYQGMILNDATGLNLSPENYDREKTIDILKQAENYSSKKYAKANVVFILSEAYTDMPKIVNEVTFDKPLTSNIDNFQNQSDAKVFDILVTSYGGISVNTEFQILSGASLYFWKPWYIPYNQFYNNYNGNKVPNLIREFNNNGYTTMYLTPWGKNSYHSEYIYTLFGTDKLIYGDSIDGILKGTNYSDESLINSIYNELKETIDGNYKFIIAASAQNHFPFPADKYSEDEFDINVTSSIYSDEDTAHLRAYAQGIYDADRTLGLLYEKIQDLEVPTIIVFYGDHFPYITNNAGEEVYPKAGYLNTDNENLNELRKYTTPAVVFSNYNVDFNDANNMNVSYLGAYILNKLELNISSYYKFLEKSRLEVPIFNRNVYYDIYTNEFKDLGEADDRITKTLNNYRNVQYYAFYEYGFK